VKVTVPVAKGVFLVNPGLLGPTFVNAALAKHISSHQLGLHQAASAFYLPERTRVTGQKVYDAIRAFDVYVTCSLGLPRTIRALDSTRDSLDASFIASHEELMAANANTALLEIMASAVEKTHRIQEISGDQELAVDDSPSLTQELAQWELKYAGFAWIPDDDTTSHPKYYGK